MIKLLFSYAIIFFVSVFVFRPVLAVPKTNPDISVNVLLLGTKSFKGKEHKEKQKSHSKRHEEGNKDLATPFSFTPLPTISRPKKPEEHENHMEHAGHGDHEDHTEHTRHRETEGTKETEEEHKHGLNDGFSVQEVEIYFKSNIDPYWTGNVSLGISQHGGDFDLDLEEAFVESLFIPSLTVRAGKFYAFLGRHNNLHTHYYPFIDPPLINQTLFGFHGWNGSGASLAYLSPLPWYCELIGQGFYSHSKEKMSGVFFFKNLWDLSDRSTLELDLSYGMGVKNYKHLYNAALVWKWKNLESAKNHSIAWTTELTQALEDGSAKGVGGLNSYIQWQFLKNWWLEGRAEYIGRPKLDSVDEQKYSLLLAFAATEYSAVRLQYSAGKEGNGDWGHSVLIQSNMSLGTHPAHLY